MDILPALADPWTWRMAWRDSRRSRGRLALFSLSISLGIAALVALGSLGDSLRDSLRDQSKSLLGAELVLGSERPPTPEVTALARRLGGEPGALVLFTSVVTLSEANNLHFAYVHAVSTNFPLLGRIEAEPASAVEAMRRGDGVLVSEAVVRQFRLKPGDPVAIGHWRARMVGTVRRMPGDGAGLESVGPRLVISDAVLPRIINPPRRSYLVRALTNVVEWAPDARFWTLVRVPDGVSALDLVREHRTELDQLGLRTDTLEQRRQRFARLFEDLEAFFDLFAVIALLLGTLGIASALQVHLEQRRVHVATLRCLGASSGSTFGIYLAQALALGMVGSLVGVLLGVSVVWALPDLFGGLLPFPVPPHLSWAAALRAIAVGESLSVAFALLALLPVRRVPPLAVLRPADAEGEARPDPARRWVQGGIAATLLVFALARSGGATRGGALAFGMGVTFLALSGTVGLLVRFTHRLRGRAGPFTWRHGLASLHRPHNRTRPMLMCLGLCTCLMLVPRFLESSLMDSMGSPAQVSGVDTVVFGVPTARVGAFGEWLRERGLPRLEQVPVATLQVRSINGSSLEAWSDQRQARQGRRAPDSIAWQKYHATLRTNLLESERLVAGRWIPRVDVTVRPAPFTVTDAFAREVGLEVGDRVGFVLAGSPLDGVLTGIREVDPARGTPLQQWNSANERVRPLLERGRLKLPEPNFQIVFPEGALHPDDFEFGVATRVGGADGAARLQDALSRDFPGVVVLDLTRLVETIRSLLARAGSIIRFIALFTFVAAGVVVVGTLLTGRTQRLQEGVLLRTLGASRGQVRRILLVEYLFLGLASAGTGAVLAVASAWMAARGLFHLDFVLRPMDLVVALLGVSVGTVLVGVLTGRGLEDAPPLEILRSGE